MSILAYIKAIKAIAKKTVQEFLADVHTNIPAQVVSYDEDLNTCSIQPCIRRLRINDPNNLTTIDLPQLNDIPVKHQGSGKGLLSVAPQVGSYGEYRITERGIQNWLAAGGVVNANSNRKFAIDDGFFDPGIYPLIADGDNGLIAEAIKTDRIEMRTRARDGFVGVLHNGNIEMDAATTIKLGLSGEKTLLAETFKIAYDAHAHPTAFGPSGPPAVLLTALSTKVTNE